jgi:hypothetical protein
MSDILEQIMDMWPDDDILKMDGYDEAVIGYDHRSFVLIYSVKKILEISMKQGMEYSEAREFHDFNSFDSYVGEKTPIFLEDEFD